MTTFAEVSEGVRATLAAYAQAREATAISDIVFLLRGEEGWAVQLVGRYRDVLRLDDGRWRFHRRTADFSS